MSTIANLDDLIALSKDRQRFKSVTKDTIIDILSKSNASRVTQASNDDEMDPDELITMKGIMKNMLHEMQVMRKTNERLVNVLERVNEMETQIQELTDANEKLHKMVMNHQFFMEGVDARERACNAIVLGLTEEKNELGDNDTEKIRCVLDAIGYERETADVSSKRIGKTAVGKKRALLLSFNSRQARDDVLEKAKVLKEFNSEEDQVTLKDVRIKKDTHPAWRKEHGRLHALVREEQKKPENAGVDINYDFKNRVVTRDGVIIDRFMPGS